MLKAMIVDDMDLARKEFKMLKIWGEDTGFKITEEARDGQEAITKLTENPVDLIITDIRMPKVNGIELLKINKEMNLCPCVVLMSENCEFKYCKQAVSLGAFDYLVKPVDELELKITLARAAQFIRDKKRQEERLKRIDAFIKIADETQIAEYIRNGDMRAILFISTVIDKIAVIFNYNIDKIAMVLKSIMLEIINITVTNYEWFDNFVDMKSIINTSVFRSMELKPIKDALVTMVEAIIIIVNSLEFSNKVNDKIRSICRYVLNNVDKEVSLTIISEKLYMNKSHISESFKKTTDITLIEYMTMVKMERAKKLIMSGNFKIFDISSKLGYKDAEYFSKVFKKHTGLTPKEFKQCRNSN
ncbi:response regulator [Clostridium sp. WILCCON 0185]|uniref:Stage 0 sporulation protein A homolog n=2 Tax=Candidatus Clostridium stratigraminis TaxID=3381661 RepID=A0ABW8TBF3_9CLOT